MAIVNVAGSPAVESPRSAINWGPILAGAFAAVVTTAVLLLLGSGLGLTLVSPWSGESASLTTFAASTAIWLVVVQWLSSAIGGYLSGRLRTRWTGIHSDEVYFRDTAHGFMAWAVATLIVIGLIGIQSTVLFGAGAHVAANVAGGAANAAGQNRATNASDNMTGYLVDMLFRPADATRLATPGAEGDQAASAAAGRILTVGAIQGEIPQEDRTYLASLVAARTGLSPQEAQARVDAIIAKAQQAAGATRKASATAAILGALSMAIGAFIAAVAGAFGGSQRDDEELVLASRTGTVETVTG